MSLLIYQQLKTKNWRAYWCGKRTFLNFDTKLLLLLNTDRKARVLPIRSVLLNLVRLDLRGDLRQIAYDDDCHLIFRKILFSHGLDIGRAD